MQVAAITLITVGGFFAVMNWACLFTSLVTKKNHSMVPPFGGLLLMIGFALLPAIRSYAICGLILDIGFWALLFAIPMMLGESLRTAPWRRVARISGHWSDITFHLSLYRPDYYAVRLSRTLPAGATGLIGWSSCGRWSSTANGLRLVSHKDKSDSPATLVLAGELESGHFIVIESIGPPEILAPEFPPAGTLLQSQ